MFERDRQTDEVQHVMGPPIGGPLNNGMIQQLLLCLERTHESIVQSWDAINLHLLRQSKNALSK